MKNNKGYSDITDFLGITLADLASYLKVSYQFMGQVARQQRKFTIPTARKLRELHQVILRIQAETPDLGQLEEPKTTKDFLQNRIADINVELSRIEKKLVTERKRAQQQAQALETFRRMPSEIPNLEPADLTWIELATEGAMLSEPDPNLERMVWQKKVLLLEKEAALKELEKEG